jgi:hypothetical protein
MRLLKINKLINRFEIANDGICYLLFAICYLLFIYLFITTSSFLSFLAFIPLIFISEAPRKRLFFIFYFLFFINNFNTTFLGYKGLGDMYSQVYSIIILLMIDVAFSIVVLLNLKKNKLFISQIFLFINGFTFIIYYIFVLTTNISEIYSELLFIFSLILFIIHIIWLIYRKEWQLLIPFYDALNKNKKKIIDFRH